MSPTTLRWRKTGPGNYRADTRGAGSYTIDRWQPSPQSDRVWVMTFIPAEGPPGERVGWVRVPVNEKPTLAWAQASCEHHHKERTAYR